MKVYIPVCFQVFILPFLASGSLSAQTAWLGNPRLSTPQWGFEHQRLVAGDFNGDGRVDIVDALFNDSGSWSGWFIANYGSDSRFWNRLLINMGNGAFREADGALPRDIDSEWKGGVSGDLDKDGDVDFILTNGFHIYIYWNNGKGAFKREVDTHGLKVPKGCSVFSVHKADMDNDGDWDIYFSCLPGVNGGGQDRLFLNDGKGFFVDKTASNFPRQADSSYRVVFADLDGDGDHDIIKSLQNPGSGRECTLWLNDGKGRFTDASGRVSTVRAASVGYRFGSMTGDVDGDGDLDLLLVPMGGKALPLVFLLNDGKAGFSWWRKVQVPSRKGWPDTVADGNSYGEHAVVFDADGDGLPDLVAACDKDPVLEPMLKGGGGRVRMWRNTGRGNFKEVTESRLGVNIINDPVEILVEDVDGDGDKDFLVDSKFGQIRLFVNNGKGFFRDCSLTDVPHEGVEPYTMGGYTRSTDFDGDGDLDLAVAVDGVYSPVKRRGVLLFRNDGEGRFTDVTDPRVPVFGPKPGSGCHEPDFMDFHDIDGDKDPDLILRWGGAYVLLNNGSGRFSLGSPGDLGRASDPWVWIDVDRDGDEGLVDYMLGVYDNRGKGKFLWTGKYLGPKSLQKKLYDPHVADVDGDGNLDIVCREQGKTVNEGFLVVLRNQGPKNFSLHQVVPVFNKDSGFQVKDLDGDGWPDLIRGWAWVYRNDREGRFKEVFGTGLPGSTASKEMLKEFVLGDLNGDGLPEILSFESHHHHIDAAGIKGWVSMRRLWRNLGDMRFVEETHLWVEPRGIGRQVGGMSGASGNRGVALLDVDGDGDLDLVEQTGWPHLGHYLGIRYNLNQQVSVYGTWGLGKKGIVEIYGHEGDSVLLFAGLPGKGIALPGLGLWRLSSKVFSLVGSGHPVRDKRRINSLWAAAVNVPRDASLLGGRVRFQGLFFRPGRGLFLSGSDTAVVTGF